jgi:hypothetical protein
MPRANAILRNMSPMKTSFKLLVSGLLAVNLVLDSAAAETFLFANGRRVGQIDKVTCQLEIGGEIVQFVDGKEKTDKVGESHKLIYSEKTLAIAPGGAKSARFYHEVDCSRKIGDDGQKLLLPDSRRLIGADATGQIAALFSPAGPLTQDEQITIDVLGNSLLLDGLLPDKPVAIGESWKHSDRFIAQMLWLDNVGQCDVQSTLREVTADVARFKIAGKALGMFKGTPSEIEIEGNYRYDRRRNRIDWLGVLVKEQRKSSPKAEGARVVARSQVLVIPRESCPELSDSALKNVSFETTPDSLRTAYQAKHDNWAIAFDRCWNMYHDVADAVEMHLLDQGDIVAQCKISALPKTDPAKLVSLEAYQRELRAALEQVKSFEAVVDSTESRTTDDYRILRVEIRGAASDLPMRWIYYHLADPQGRQAVFAIVVEEKLYDRLAQKDKALVQAFRFTETRK